MPKIGYEAFIVVTLYRISLGKPSLCVSHIILIYANGKTAHPNLKFMSLKTDQLNATQHNQTERDRKKLIKKINYTVQ